MDRKLNRINKLFPWYSGLSGDFLFYIPIMTIWLTQVKDFTEQQYILLFTIASLFAICFQVLAIKIIKKIGNTKSVRFGAFCLLVSIILITFSTHYLLFVLAVIIGQTGWIFRKIETVLIKNNLDYQSKSKNFVEIISKGNVIYATLTMVVALIVGVLFNIHPYLPMALAILNMLICFCLTFLLFDIEDKLPIKKEKQVKVKSNKFPQPFKLVLIILFIFGISSGLFTIGASSGQLLAQNELLEYFSLNQAAIYLSIIIFVTRLVRLLVNMIYPKIYNRYNDRVGVILSAIIVCSMLLMVIGFYANVAFIIKITLITIGLSLIVASFDPMNLFMQNICLTRFDKIYHQELISYLGWFRKIGTFTLGLLMTLMLTAFPLEYVMIMFLITTLPLLYMYLRLKSMLKA